MAGYSNIVCGAALAVCLAGLASADELSTVTSNDLCPANLATLAKGIGTVVSCWCPAATLPGQVWGSGPYTVDSSLCSAARHAGAVGADGGAIWARITKGETSYSGTAANGVTSQDYGEFEASLSVAARPAVGAVSVAQCPATMENKAGALTCLCPETATKEGSVWGTDIYTADSAICRAAVHAGAIGGDGGTVSIIAVGGQPSYVGSDRNGVVSAEYGAFGASFMFAN